MENDNIITVEDEYGNTKNYHLEALFDMNDEWYALLKSEQERVLMRVIQGEGDEQYLVSIDDPEEAASIMDAYEIALEAEEGENEKPFRPLDGIARKGM